MNETDIDTAVKLSELDESRLSEHALAVGGYTSPRIRYLLDALGELSDCYLEVGAHRGATFMAAMEANNHLQGMAIENFSQFNDGTVEKELRANVRLLGKRATLLVADCWSVTQATLKCRPDLFFYDGPHTEDDHSSAMTHFIPMLTTEFLVAIDDWSWEAVRKGTRRGLDLVGVDVLYERELWDGKLPDEGGEWHNGLWLAWMRRR